MYECVWVCGYACTRICECVLVCVCDHAGVCVRACAYARVCTQPGKAREAPRVGLPGSRTFYVGTYVCLRALNRTQMSSHGRSNHTAAVGFLEPKGQWLVPQLSAPQPGPVRPLGEVQQQPGVGEGLEVKSATKENLRAVQRKMPAHNERLNVIGKT